MRRVLPILIASCAVAGAADAQGPPADACGWLVAPSAAVDPLMPALQARTGSRSADRPCDADGTRARQGTAEPGPASPGRAFAFSAVLPGMGQRYLGQSRWIVYLGVEAWSWFQFFDHRSEGSSLQSAYRDLAWSVARRLSRGPRVDGTFEYYESMTTFRESGAYDADPERAGLQPETDPETFNGRIWELAGDIFFPPESDEAVPEDSPAYRNAVEYYRERSITPEFTWSWTENELQQSVYSGLIEQSDETLRDATTMVGVILANHLVSAVDALISARLRIGPESVSATVVPLVRAGPDWALIVRVSP